MKNLSNVQELGVNTGHLLGYLEFIRVVNIKPIVWLNYIFNF